jgi:hypothetical protein
MKTATSTPVKFADKIIRESFDIVFVKRSEKEMEAREEFNSNLWNIEKINISSDKWSSVNLYSTPVRDVKIGENIYDEEGNFITYRSN